MHATHEFGDILVFILEASGPIKTEPLTAAERTSQPLVVSR